MDFDNLTVFRLSGGLPDTDELDAKLRKVAFASCLGLERFSEGFVPPTPLFEDMSYPVGHTVRLSLRREEKVLPPAVINEAVNRHIEAVRQREGRQVGKRERAVIRDAVVDAMLPRAFVKTTHTAAVIDRKKGLLLIGTPSEKKAGDFIARLAEALGGLAVMPPETAVPPKTVMTEWLSAGSAAGSFELDRDSTLTGEGKAAPVIKASKQDLTAEEIANLARTGKSVTQLGLFGRSGIEFILTDTLTFKRIRYAKTLTSQIREDEEHPEAAFAAGQLLMTEVLTETFEELVSLFGGLAER